MGKKVGRRCRPGRSATPPRAVSRGKSSSAQAWQSPDQAGQRSAAIFKNEYRRVDGTSTVTARFTTTLLAASAAAAALAVSISGCGSTSATLDPVAKAAETTSRAGGARVSISGSITGLNGATALTLQGDGSFNFSAHEGSLLLVLGGLPASAQSQLGGSSLEMNELFKSGSLYIGSPLFDGKLPGGARWLRLDLARLGQAIGLDPSSLTSGSADPAATLKYLSAGGGTASVVGREAVRGVPTTHYAGRLDLLKAAEAAPGGASASARAAFKKLIAQTGAGSVPIDTWVDGHHLVRRISMSFDMHANGQELQMKLQLEFHDFGSTPSVRAPASSEVFDVTSDALRFLPSGG
jgi:hypothetical protein